MLQKDKNTLFVQQDIQNITGIIKGLKYDINRPGSPLKGGQPISLLQLFYYLGIGTVSMNGVANNFIGDLLKVFLQRFIQRIKFRP